MIRMLSIPETASKLLRLKATAGTAPRVQSQQAEQPALGLDFCRQRRGTAQTASTAPWKSIPLPLEHPGNDPPVNNPL